MELETPVKINIDIKRTIGKQDISQNDCIFKNNEKNLEIKEEKKDEKNINTELKKEKKDRPLKYKQKKHLGKKVGDTQKYVSNIEKNKLKDMKENKNVIFKTEEEINKQEKEFKKEKKYQDIQKSCQLDVQNVIENFKTEDHKIIVEDAIENLDNQLSPKVYLENKITDSLICNQSKANYDETLDQNSDRYNNDLTSNQKINERFKNPQNQNTVKRVATPPNSKKNYSDFISDKKTLKNNYSSNNENLSKNCEKEQNNSNTGSQQASNSYKNNSNNAYQNFPYGYMYMSAPYGNHINPNISQGLNPYYGSNKGLNIMGLNNFNYLTQNQHSYNNNHINEYSNPQYNNYNNFRKSNNNYNNRNNMGKMDYMDNIYDNESYYLLNDFNKKMNHSSKSGNYNMKNLNVNMQKSNNRNFDMEKVDYYELKPSEIKALKSPVKEERLSYQKEQQNIGISQINKERIDFHTNNLKDKSSKRTNSTESYIT